MIGFYVDVGYSSGGSIGNISKITFTDFNRPFGFPIVSKQGEFTSIYQGNGTYPYEEALQNYYTYCSDYLGNEINSIYVGTIDTVFHTTSRTWINNLLVQIPSFSKSFPNLWNYYLAPHNNGGFFIYFKSLKRVLEISFGTNSNGTYIWVYSVADDGTLTSLYNTWGRSWFTATQESTNGAYVFIPGIVKYSGPEDLKNVENFVEVEFRYGPQRQGGYSFSGVYFSALPFSTTNNYVGRMQSILTALFGQNTGDPEIVIVPPVNPYNPVDPSGPGDLPPGTFDDTSDPIPDSPLPTLSAANTGFTRIYNPTLAQVQALARYLWTDESVVQTIWNKIKQYFEDPMQAILGFNLVPVPVPDGGQEEFALMYIPTGVTMTVAANQFVDVDCGTLTLDRYYGSALDQSPYTKIHAFLPFIGTVRLNTDEVMGTTLAVKYRVDIVSGSCVAKIFVDGNCLYQYSGHCAITIPISSADFSTYVSAAINVAKTAAMGAAAGSASMSTPPTLSPLMMGGGVTGGLALSQGAPLTDYLPPVGPQPGDWQLQPPSQVPANISPSSIANTVSQVSGGKPYIEHSGSFSGNSGYLGIRRPFLIIERPNMCLPENYQSLNGYPSMITLELGKCSGFTRVQQVQLTGMPATSVEQAEIMGLLKDGVVF